MNSRYTCFMCGTPVSLESKLVLRHVRGWARSTSKTLAIVEQEDYKFVHENCLNSEDSKDDQLALF